MTIEEAVKLYDDTQAEIERCRYTIKEIESGESLSSTGRAVIVNILYRRIKELELTLKQTFYPGEDK